MPFSHHSHSGQFCGHATNTLEEVVKDAISKGMTTFCMTEHIPRGRIDFYPGEEEVHTPESLEKLYDDFYHEARRLQEAYAAQIQLFVGFEGEWIRESSLGIIQKLMDKYPPDVFIGSVHHVHTVPIDYDASFYREARSLAGGSDEQLFADYFDIQHTMLLTLEPPVVGHFDLIRLKSDDPDRSFKTWPGVWDKIIRNLRTIRSFDGVLELNSSSLRKGMKEAYPQVEICQEFRMMGGRFTLSDDSHGIEQVGLNYDKVFDCIKEAGITELVHQAPIPPSVQFEDGLTPKVGWKTVSVSKLADHGFWKK